MTSLATHSSGSFVKLFYVGHSGTGKTGSLISLVEAGYTLRILDMDNGVDPLKALILHRCPDRVGQVDVETVRDKIRPTNVGPKILGGPRAYVDATKLMDKWSDGTTPSDWGSNVIFVLDTLTNFSRAALAWAEALNPTVKDQRLHVGNAQRTVTDIIAMLMAEDFHCHVIVISHIDMRKQDDGTTRGFIATVGEALGPKLPNLVNTFVAVEKHGQGKNVKRKILTLPTSLLDLKNPSPFTIDAEYPLETGMAEIFAKLRGSQKENL